MIPFPRTILSFALMAVLAYAHPAAASGCANFQGQRCQIRLSTGIAMTYYHAGAEGGEALIFLHGMTLSSRSWAPAAAALLRLHPGLDIYALDQRGVAGTGTPDTPECWAKPATCLRSQDRADDVVAFMDANHIRKATLIGHSMGSLVAQAVALQHPDRVVRLVLVSTGLSGPTRVASGTHTDGLLPLGWQKMLEDRGVKWPEGAYHLRPLDFDPDAVRNIIQNWDISAVAPREIVETEAEQTAQDMLATFGALDPTPVAVPALPVENWKTPTLVLWGAQDITLERRRQDDLIAALRTASTTNQGMYFYWKQYGVRPPPSRDKHLHDDIGHDLLWEAPDMLAADIDSFIRTGAPTRDLVHTDAPADIHKLVVEPGRAVIVSSRP